MVLDLRLRVIHGLGNCDYTYPLYTGHQSTICSEYTQTVNDFPLKIKHDIIHTIPSLFWLVMRVLVLSSCTHVHAISPSHSGILDHSLVVWPAFHAFHAFHASTISTTQWVSDTVLVQPAFHAYMQYQPR